MNIRNRVVELRHVLASDLQLNKKNWRQHPPQQQSAVLEMLADIGYADALIARQTEDGQLFLIDGHLRAGLTPEQKVPVIVVDLNQDESDKLLLTLDPLAAMADVDSCALKLLLDSVDSSGEAISCLYEEMAEAAGLCIKEIEHKRSTREIDVDSFEMQCCCPQCGFEFNDKNT